jgi:hypothetical protein
MYKTLLTALALVLATPALAAIEYLGTETRWGWEQPAWPGDAQPDGWKVYVSRNGGDFLEEQTVTTKETVVTGTANDTIQLKVSATLGPYETELSEPGELVTLRVIERPGSVAIKCDQPLVEISPGWWTCP